METKGEKTTYKVALSAFVNHRERDKATTPFNKCEPGCLGCRKDPSTSRVRFICHIHCIVALQVPNAFCSLRGGDRGKAFSFFKIKEPIGGIGHGWIEPTHVDPCQESDRDEAFQKQEPKTETQNK